MVRPAAWPPLRLVARHARSYRRHPLLFAAGFADPLLYLLSIGLGVGALIGELDGPAGPVAYEAFVAPGLLAVTAMNGAVFDTTFNFFVKFKYIRTYEGVLATPLGTRDVAAGEVVWAVARGAIYAAAFLLTMLAFGLVDSPWAVLALPAAVLVAFAFAGVGLAGATYLRSYIDFDFVNLAVVPLFLFSGTFFPLARYPSALEWVVRATPLYQGVALERSLVLGGVDASTLGHAAYLVAMGTIGLRVAGRRLARLMQP